MIQSPRAKAKTLLALFFALIFSGLSDAQESQDPVGETETVVEIDEQSGTDTVTEKTVVPPSYPEAWRKIKNGLIVIVAAPFVEMHTFSGRGYPIFHVVEKGEKIILVKQHNDWFKGITTDNKIGWIKRGQLEGSYDERGNVLGFRELKWRDHIENRWRTGLLAGHFENVISYSPFLGYSFTDNISTEIKYTQAFGDFSTLKLASINLVHKPFPSWRYSPYFSLGSGIIQTLPGTVLAESEDRDDSVLTAGAGVLWHFSHRLTVRLEYNSHTILTSRDENEEIEQWQAGFSVLF